MFKLLASLLLLWALLPSRLSHCSREQSQKQLQQLQEQRVLNDLMNNFNLTLKQTKYMRPRSQRREAASDDKMNEYWDSKSNEILNKQIDAFNLKVGRDIYMPEQMDFIYKMFKYLDDFQNKIPTDDLELAGIWTRSHSLIYDDLVLHRYESYAELKDSNGPHVNQKLCLKQLQHLSDRTDVLEMNKRASRDVHLYRFLDTFGRFAPGMSSGSLVWPGMYDECLSLKIDTEEGNVPTRYCLASLRRNSWPHTDRLSKISAFKAGVCLPKACDSMQYKNKFQLLDRLMNANVRESDRDQLKVDSLYCVPEEDSPMRMWWRIPAALQAVAVLGAWLVVLLYATIRYEMIRSRVHARAGNRKLVGLTKCDSALVEAKLNFEAEEEEAAADEASLKVYRMMAMTYHLKALFRTTTRPVELPQKAEMEMSESEKLQLEAKLNPVINLSCLEGIKVICMWYIVIAHVLMAISSIMSNGRDLASTTSPAFVLANMMPAFAVNAFFTITGILTSYLLLKQNESHSFMTNPAKWLAIIVFRYLRIMPMYAVVVYYCKYISKFTGAGPEWDYGTSSLSLRRRCEQESWLWTLLFGANFKSPFDHCIPSAWYLANDFQFFLVTPIFMIALHKNAELGKRLLKCCIVAGFLLGVYKMSTVDADLRPVAEFMPHGFKTYVTYLSNTYTHPQYRIPAYLCGILLGFYLYKYEQRKLQFRASLRKLDKDDLPEEPQWPKWLLERGLLYSLLMVLACGFIPLLGARLNLSKMMANFMVGLMMSSYHIVFALAIGMYILLATTGHGNQLLNRIMSSPFWKPLSRLSLCVVLVNIEVVNYLFLTQKHQIHIDFFSHTAFNCLSIVASYLVAIVAYVCFEAPLKTAFNQFVSRLLNESSSKQKTQ